VATIRAVSRPHSAKGQALRHYWLADTKDGATARVDIEEAKNLASEIPEKAAAMEKSEAGDRQFVSLKGCTHW
jgi:hypothetical protein